MRGKQGRISKSSVDDASIDQTREVCEGWTDVRYIRSERFIRMRQAEIIQTTGVRTQDIVCILGMHRSGTSALTRVLNLIGVDLGSEEILTTEPVADNPKGYWEHGEITAISDAILKGTEGVGTRRRCCRQVGKPPRR